MMDFFNKILLSEEVFNKMNIYLVLFLKKKIWSKNAEIYFRQFKLTLAEGGFRVRKKQNKNVYEAIKM